jgi:CheY-like chemotaxis protein
MFMSPKRILIVDDEPLVCESIQMVLGCDRHQTETAKSGPEALAKFDAQTFDLVFTDYFMPGMKGDALAHAIKERDQSQPIVLLTGFPPMEHLLEVDLVVLKPFSQETLRRAITKLLHSTGR